MVLRLVGLSIITLFLLCSIIRVDFMKGFIWSVCCLVLAVISIGHFQ